ncbi:MAG: glycosyl transferase [Oscillospiraceae bacterium]|nr:glycosyl transferase [Oscillospiraceae bacterium]
MIPKTIHYCWFGGNEKPKSAVKCINSWKKHCADFEIIEWNEDNIDIDKCPKYIRDAYAAKKYAFVSDYVRLKVLFDNGGFYMDTDVELLKPLAQFLGDKAVIGFENDEFVNSGQMLASEDGHPIIEEMMKVYENIAFYGEDGKMFLLGCPHVNTDVLVNHGLVKNGKEQMIADVHVYPEDWFNPLDSATGVLCKTENTVSVHWYSMSWISPAKQLRVKIMRRVRRALKPLLTKGK